MKRTSNSEKINKANELLDTMRKENIDKPLKATKLTFDHSVNLQKKTCDPGPNVKFTPNTVKIFEYLKHANVKHTLGCGPEQYPKYTNDDKYCCEEIAATDQELLDYINELLTNTIPHFDIETYNYLLDRNNRDTLKLPDKFNDDNDQIFINDLINKNFKTTETANNSTLKRLEQSNRMLNYLIDMRNVVMRRNKSITDSLITPWPYDVAQIRTNEDWVLWIDLLIQVNINPWRERYDLLKTIINEQTKETLLITAVKMKFVLVVGYLVKKVQVEVNHKDADGKTAVDYATSFEDDETKQQLITLLLGRADSDGQNISKPPPLKKSTSKIRAPSALTPSAVGPTNSPGGAGLYNGSLGASPTAGTSNELENFKLKLPIDDDKYKMLTSREGAGLDGYKLTNAMSGNMVLTKNDFIIKYLNGDSQPNLITELNKLAGGGKRRTRRYQKNQKSRKNRRKSYNRRR